MWSGGITGIHNFTIGQRKGLGVATGSPLYVIGIRGDKKEVVVGGQKNLYSRELSAHRLNWISIAEIKEPIRVEAKIRHKHQAAAGDCGARWGRRRAGDLRRAAALYHAGSGRSLSTTGMS